MSAIDGLVAELCPDGVEYKQLWQVTTWDKRFNGVDRAKQPAINPHHYYLAKELQPVLAEQGNIKVLTTNQTSLYTTEDLVDESHIKDGEIIAIPWGGNAVVQYYKGRYITSDNRIAVVNTESIMTKFLFHVLKSREEELSSYYRGAGIKHPEMSKVLGMEIPVPPIEVQREIVRILDAFTELTDTMTEELEARKAQYSYYRDRLLSRESLEELDGKPVEMKRLDEVIQNLRTGLNPRKNFKLNTPDATNNYITVRELDGMDFKIDQKTDKVNDAGLELILKRAAIRRNDILFSGTGTIGNTALVKEAPTDWGIKEGVYAISPDVETVRPKFLIYLFHTTACKKWFERKAMGGAVKSVSMADLKMLPIPVPSLETQQKVVDILDLFDSLTASLTDGLPAEIEARKAQYGYYRDRLLDFPRKSGDAA